MDNQTLIKLPTLEEVCIALFSMNSNKTLGPDEFGAGFFKTYWHILKGDLFDSVAEFFRNGELLKEVNHTFIALIPKVSNPSNTGHFRPISPCSMLSKIISKVMANRLLPLLGKIISPFQSAFIPGRSIHDNILLTHEIMHKFKKIKSKQTWVAVKIDMEKAYDRLEWHFIIQASWSWYSIRNGYLGLKNVYLLFLTLS